MAMDDDGGTTGSDYWLQQLQSGNLNAEPTPDLTSVLSAFYNSPALVNDGQSTITSFGDSVIPPSTQLTYSGQPSTVFPSYGSMASGASNSPTATAGSTGTTAPDYNAILESAYQSQLGRASDPSGLSYWSQQLQSGQITPDQIDAIFASSPEGTLHAQTGQVYDPNQVNAVNAAYRNELGRATDQPGFNYWLGQVQSGQMPQNLLGQAFSNTPEGLKYDVSQLVGGNVPSTDYVSPDVQKYYAMLPGEYQKYLYRAPDVSGAQYWTQQLMSGAVKQSDLDKIFSTSPEGQVQSAYMGTLGHIADPTNLANWLGKLGTGTTQADIINALKQTAEYQKLHPYTGTTTQSGATTTANQPKTMTIDQLNQEAAATGMGRRFTPAEMDAFYSYGQRPEHVFYKPTSQTTTTTTTE